MEKQFWASRTMSAKKQVGPCATREEALSLYRATYPLTKNEQQKRNRDTAVGRILTGYGAFGPHFDMRWHSAVEGTE